MADTLQTHMYSGDEDNDDDVTSGIFPDEMREEQTDSDVEED